MGFNNCDNCGGPISWDKQRRAALNTKRPLNHDGTIHSCGGNGMHQPQQQSQPQQKPVQKAVTDQDQKSMDIKAAQLERRIQHKQLIQNMQWLTKAIVRDIAAREDSEAKDIMDSIGFEESREEQRESFMDEVV
jgi:hypothetical protein